MIFTARQLQDLHKANGHVSLPVGARLTPLAQDWVRARQIDVVYGNGQARRDAQAPAQAAPAPVGVPSFASSFGPATATPVAPVAAAPLPAMADQVLWWCDGPCGPAKAALAQQARETNVQPVPVPAESKHLVAAIRHLAGEVRAGRASAGVMLVQAGASAVVLANRCPSLRAILGTCRQSVEQGLNEVAANVLIVEHPHHTLPQVRNMLSLFVSRQRTLNDEVRRQLEELSAL